MAAAVKEREGVGGVDREGRRASLDIRTGRDEEGEWEIEKILIKNACIVEQ
jgi:hypothetical protein